MKLEKWKEEKIKGPRFVMMVRIEFKISIYKYEIETIALDPWVTPMMEGLLLKNSKPTNFHNKLIPSYICHYLEM